MRPFLSGGGAGDRGFQGCGLSILRIGYLAPRMLLFVSLLVVWRFLNWGMSKQHSLTVFLEFPKVKAYKHGFISEPKCIPSTTTLRALDELAEACGFTPKLICYPPQSWVSLVSQFIFPQAVWIGPYALGPCSYGKQAGSLAEPKQCHSINKARPAASRASPWRRTGRWARSCSAWWRSATRTSWRTAYT